MFGNKYDIEPDDSELDRICEILDDLYEVDDREGEWDAVRDRYYREIDRSPVWWWRDPQ